MHGGLSGDPTVLPTAASEQLTRKSLPALDLCFCAFNICGKAPRAPRATSLHFLLIGLVGHGGPQCRQVGFPVWGPSGLGGLWAHQSWRLEDLVLVLAVWSGTSPLGFLGLGVPSA